jgi:hypothetical protein
MTDDTNQENQTNNETENGMTKDDDNMPEATTVMGRFKMT